MKHIACLILTLALLAAAPGLGEQPWLEVVGETLPDFEATCADGTVFRLSEALRDRRLALIVLFGSGCGACRRAMAALEAGWGPYREEVAVIGLSLDRTYDTEEALRAYALEAGLSFPLARDPARTARFLRINSYPAFMLVDASRTVRWTQVGGSPAAADFAALLEAFLSEDPAPGSFFLRLPRSGRNSAAGRRKKIG